MLKYSKWWCPGSQSVSLQMGKGRGEGEKGRGAILDREECLDVWEWGWVGVDKRI